MSQRISLFGRFWSRLRYDAQKARETYDYYRPVNPQMWQFWTGSAICVLVFGLKIMFPWNLPNDFPPSQADYDAYYTKKRLEEAKDGAAS